jgi:hypothetical protein
MSIKKSTKNIKKNNSRTVIVLENMNFNILSLKVKLL